MPLLMEREQRECGSRIDEAVRLALRRSGYGELLQLDVMAENGRVRLAGCLPSYYLKQKAQMLAMSVDGVRRLQNDVVVR